MQIGQSEALHRKLQPIKVKKVTASTKQGKDKPIKGLAL